MWCIKLYLIEHISINRYVYKSQGSQTDGWLHYNRNESLKEKTEQLQTQRVCVQKHNIKFYRPFFIQVTQSLTGSRVVVLPEQTERFVSWLYCLHNSEESPSTVGFHHIQSPAAHHTVFCVSPTYHETPCCPSGSAGGTAALLFCVRPMSS